MSNHFYEYLAEKVRSFFQQSVLRAGDKYHIQFERKDQVENLVQVLRTFDCAKPFEMPKASYTSFSLQMQGLDVIVASTLSNTTPDFLTRIRNMVGVEGDPLFQSTAMLLVHDSNLDSLVNGMTSFSKEGMPFHMKSLEDDLHTMMVDSALSKTEKTVLEFVLDIKKEETFQEQQSLFEYQDLLKVLHKGGISKQDYIDFGLFHDPDLEMLEMTPKKTKDRLKENYDLFQKVETLQKYGEVESELEKLFDDAGVRALKKEDWKEKPFTDVWESNKKKKEDKGLEYLESNKKKTKEEMIFWERPDGESKAKQRIRHILIFNPQGHENLTLEFSFNDFMKSKYISALKATKSSVEASGKKLIVQFQHERGKTNFLRFSYKTETSNKFEFRIASVECSEAWMLPIQTAYKIYSNNNYTDTYILIQSEESEWVFNPEANEPVQIELTGKEEQDRFTVMEHQKVMIGKNILEQHDEDLLRFQVCLPTADIPFAVEDVVERPTSINGFNVWKLKRQKQEHFTLKVENDKFKILQGTRENYAQGEFRKCLERELKMIELGSLSYREQLGELEAVSLPVPNAVETAYEKLISYFRAYKTLPSLAFMDEEYQQLAKEYMGAFLYELDVLTNGQGLDQQQRNLALVGTIECLDGDHEWLYSPLHPLNLAYQLHVNALLGDEAVGDEVLKTLRSECLLPYVMYRDNKVYKPIEQHETPEWTVYVDHDLPRYEGNRNFVNKLIHEKIEEFTKHFAYLFELDNRASLKINVINMGDGREILQGILEYYKSQLKKKVSKADLLPIDLNIYAESGASNVFEELSLFEEVDQIIAHFDLKLNVEDYRPEEILNLLREKVHFYSKNVQNSEYEYCHLAFYQMRKIEKTASSSMSEIPTGLSLEGLLSGVPSVFVNDNYKTGFGAKYYPKADSQLLRFVPKWNAFLRVALTLDSYMEDMTLVTAISNEQKDSLDRVYQSSHWVTFVEPRVDLSFFKSDLAQKDLLVIHYSDQYTSSSTFDAITVTRRSRQYQQLIQEFLETNHVPVHKESLPQIINFFNAMNGNWLLRLLAQQNYFPKEKISILSAVKLALAYFDRPNILWIPISMEEVLRISGGTGLKQSEGLFSAKNLGQAGSYSDDLLLIGVEDSGEGLKVHFYPIEVKIGQNGSQVKTKAIEQVKRTFDLIQEYLSGSTIHAKIYRNFFMQLAIVNAEKMRLYDVWPEQRWEWITEDNNRERLLNDHYDIIFNANPELGKGAIIFFSKEVIFEDTAKEDDITMIHYPESTGYHFLLRSIEELKAHMRGELKEIIPPQTERSNQVLPKEEIQNLEEEAEHIPKDESIEENKETEMLQNLVEQEILQTHDEAAPAQVSKPLSVLFGNTVKSNQEVRWYPTTTDKVMHTNTGIIGTMGTGKTQFTKSLIAQLSRNSSDNVNGTKIGILIFDYKGDYIKPEFANATGAKVYDLFHLPFNPLALYLGGQTKNLLPVHTANMLTDTITKAFNLGQVQNITLRELFMKAYEKKGIHKINKETWNLPAPTMQDVFQLYQTEQMGKIDSLYAALKDLNDFEVFHPDPSETIALYDMIDGITVINLSGYNESIQNLVVAITLDVFYMQMQVVGHSTIDGTLREITKIILVDEADNFLSKDFDSVKKILKEGREFGVGTILSTQFMNHFSTTENDYANYILTWIVHNVAEMTAKDIRMIFNTQTKSEEESMMSKIKTLEKHYSIVKGVGPSPTWMRDKAFWELMKKN